MPGRAGTKLPTCRNAIRSQNPVAKRSGPSWRPLDRRFGSAADLAGHHKGPAGWVVPNNIGVPILMADIPIRTALWTVVFAPSCPHLGNYKAREVRPAWLRALGTDLVIDYISHASGTGHKENGLG